MNIIEFKRGVWNVINTDTDQRKKFGSEEEAKAFAGVKDAPKEKIKREVETSWSDGIQQTKADTQSPEKKPYSSGESGHKDKNNSFWSAGSKDGGEA